MRHYLIALLCLAVVAIAAPRAATAGDFVTAYETASDFDAVAADLEDAIVNRGYVINSHDYIADMLQRTAQAVGATKTVYRNAEVLEFCSAILTRAMMEADPRNIAFCPLAVFVYQTEARPETVVVGYRSLPPGDGRDDINALLDGIAREVAGE